MTRQLGWTIHVSPFFARPCRLELVRACAFTSRSYPLRPMSTDPPAAAAADNMSSHHQTAPVTDEGLLSIQELHQLVRSLEDNMCNVVLGKPDAVRMCLAALLAGEHVLLEDVPGVGKTLVGKALAKSVAGDFCRLQFTPDLLPSDIVGSSVFHAKTSEFVYQPRSHLFEYCAGRRN